MRQTHQLRLQLLSRRKVVQPSESRARLAAMVLGALPPIGLRVWDARSPTTRGMSGPSAHGRMDGPRGCSAAAPTIPKRGPYTFT